MTDGIPPWEIEGLTEPLTVYSFEEAGRAIDEGKLPEKMREFLRGHFETSTVSIDFVPKS